MILLIILLLVAAVWFYLRRLQQRVMEYYTYQRILEYRNPWRRRTVRKMRKVLEVRASYKRRMQQEKDVAKWKAQSAKKR